MTALPGVATSQAPQDNMPPTVAKRWCVYILECTGGTLYTGITNALEERYKAHVAGRGARYTRAHRPRRIAATEPFPDRSAASRAEWHIKQAPRARKLQLLVELASMHRETGTGH